MRSIIFVFLLLFTSCQNKKPRVVPDAEIKALEQKITEGDIIFQTSLSAQSKAIQLATHSKWSHMGILFKANDEWLVYEASNVVKATPLKKWIERGQSQRYTVKTLSNWEVRPTMPDIEEMRKVANGFLGKKYDLYFEWSDDKMYCSELVWKIYDSIKNVQIGKLQHLKDFDLSNETVKKKMKERFGDKIPMDELVISPQSMFESELLISATGWDFK